MMLRGVFEEVQSPQTVLKPTGFPNILLLTKGAIKLTSLKPPWKWGCV